LHTLIYFAMLAAIMVSAYLSYLLFESRTYRIRNAAKRFFLQHPAARPEGSPVSTER
jgi:hypothetical protein